MIVDDDVFSETDLAFECVDDELDSETLLVLLLKTLSFSLPFSECLKVSDEDSF